MTNIESHRMARVGIFVGLSLVTLVVVLALLGRSRSLFTEKAVLYASFDNISGLVVGSPVRLAGVDIGMVSSIRFEHDLQVKKVRVSLGLQGKYMDRIRTDSIAHLGSKGLLGDMLINISIGSPRLPQLHDGDLLPAQESDGMSQVVGTVQDGINDVRKLVAHIDSRLQVVLNDDVAKDLQRILHTSANLMEGVEHGSGLLHELIYSPQLAKSAVAVIADAQQSAQHLARALSRMDGVLVQVEKGNGTLHSLLYQDDGSKLLVEARHAVTELSGILTEVRQGTGVLHGLVYDDDKTNLVADLTATSHILRSLAEQLQQGKGTIGGLLRDPSIYQDLKLILGNVQRNALLKVLIRAAITSDGLKR